jgi:hypothetical protein
MLGNNMLIRCVIQETKMKAYSKEDGKEKICQECVLLYSYSLKGTQGIRD